ncbi:MAG: SGNH/GDSL hydrolase family protein [Sedimentisphaerales bacterium]
MSIANPRTYLTSLIKVIKTQWPKNSSVNVVCHGHSVPAGYSATPLVQTFDAYPHLFHRLLKERFPYAVINVIVTAVGGEESVSGSARFEKEVLCHRPDVLLIDYGMNDHRVGLKKAANAWVSMIKKTRTARSKVLLCTPTFDSDLAYNPSAPGTRNLLAHTKLIRELATTYNVGLVDCFAAFENVAKAGIGIDSLLSTSNHPNRKGHEIIAAEIMKYFQIL